MNLEDIQRAISQLQELNNASQALEAYLKYLQIESGNLIDQQHIYGLLDRLKKLEHALTIEHALARVDFEDDYYTFVRAIDGDTIVVEPPSQLQQWMKDIHIRLYGLETPELWEELGHEYRQHLHNLCAIDAQKRLRIVWERERMGTNYEGFPLTSFERGIGHIFFKVAEDNRFLYVNGLMHLLKHSTLYRHGQLLLRGRSYLGKYKLDLPFSGLCPIQIESGAPEVSETFRQIQRMRPPICLLLYPKLPSLDPREASSIRNFLNTIESVDFGCPFSAQLGSSRRDELSLQMETLRASPFDVALVLISQWANAQFHQMKE